MWRLGRLIEDYGAEILLVVILAIIAAIIAGAIAGINENTQAREAFLEECRQHRPNYECVALWRSGNQRNVVVPMVVPVPTR